MKSLIQVAENPPEQLKDEVCVYLKSVSTTHFDRYLKWENTLKRLRNGEGLLNGSIGRDTDYPTFSILPPDDTFTTNLASLRSTLGVVISKSMVDSIVHKHEGKLSDLEISKQERRTIERNNSVIINMAETSHGAFQGYDYVITPTDDDYLPTPTHAENRKMVGLLISLWCAFMLAVSILAIIGSDIEPSWGIGIAATLIATACISTVAIAYYLSKNVMKILQ